MKICTKCNKSKEMEFFHKCISCKDGYNTICKKCRNLMQKQYRKENKDIIVKNQKKYYEQNKDYFEKYHLKYFKKNKKAINLRIKQYRINNKNKVEEQYSKSKDKINSNKRKRWQERYSSDELFKLKHNLRRRIYHAFNSQKLRKNSPTRKIIGCSIEELKVHIEKQFKVGMNWKNNKLKHGWHVDHIIPLSSANTKEELIKLCHYTNLQPLWAKENMAKGSKLY